MGDVHGAHQDQELESDVLGIRGETQIHACILQHDSLAEVQVTA